MKLSEAFRGGFILTVIVSFIYSCFTFAIYIVLRLTGGIS